METEVEKYFKDKFIKSIIKINKKVPESINTNDKLINWIFMEGVIAGLEYSQKSRKVSK